MHPAGTVGKASFAALGALIAGGALLYLARGAGSPAGGLVQSISDSIDEITPTIEDATGTGPAPQEVIAMSGEQNVQAFLSMIRYSEGTASEAGYMTLVGGDLFYDFTDHPRQAITIQTSKGPITSTAAGAYQFLSRTWDDARAALELEDFSPENQDAAAVWLIRRRGALADVRGGNFDAAVRKCAKEWASLPGSPYGQPVRTLAQVQAVYQNAGGVIAA
jgi:muramidase (phage lysozyme)